MLLLILGIALVALTGAVLTVRKAVKESRTLTAPKRQVMPQKFSELAGYNSEVYRGVLHDPETKARMRRLQAEFDVWARQSHEAAEALLEGEIDLDTFLGTPERWRKNG